MIEAQRFMRQKQMGHVSQTSSEEEEDEWRGEVWEATDIDKYLSESGSTARCIVMLRGFIVDVTPYLREHVSLQFKHLK